MDTFEVKCFRCEQRGTRGAGQCAPASWFFAPIIEPLLVACSAACALHAPYFYWGRGLDAGVVHREQLERLAERPSEVEVEFSDEVEVRVDFPEATVSAEDLEKVRDHYAKALGIPKERLADLGVDRWSPKLVAAILAGEHGVSTIETLQEREDARLEAERKEKERVVGELTDRRRTFRHRAIAVAIAVLTTVAALAFSGCGVSAEARKLVEVQATGIQLLRNTSEPAPVLTDAERQRWEKAWDVLLENVEALRMALR